LTTFLRRDDKLATDDLKEMLVDYSLEGSEDVKDWKRVSKKKMNGVDVRTFENINTKAQYWTFGDASEESHHPADTHFYFLGEGEDYSSPTGKSLMAAFNPASYWAKEGCLWDQHCGHVIETVYNLPSWIELDEVMENSFIISIPDDKTEADVKQAFDNAGLVFNQGFHDFMASHI
jgi:hypothetical protein